MNMQDIFKSSLLLLQIKLKAEFGNLWRYYELAYYLMRPALVLNGFGLVTYINDGICYRPW